MKRISVRSTTHPYNIYIGENIRFNTNQFLAKKYSSVFIITDEIVAELYLADIKKNISHDRIFHTILAPGEQSKDIKTYYQLHTEAIQYGLDRQSLIIALGGGVVGDLAGFVAATYMRGIDYIQMPTTILAHDSSVGGKVAINHTLGKNLIGSFHSPIAVIYDIQTLESLSEKEIRSGYAELIKEASIADRDFLETLLHINLQSLTMKQLEFHIQKGISIKTSIVEFDEREKDTRKFLNFGHTLGHALESELGYGVLTHGEAVAIGMLFAIYVSEQTFSNNLPYEQMLNWLRKNHYPLTFPDLNQVALINKMKLDKKAVNNHVQMVLLKKISEPTLMEINEHDLNVYMKAFLKEMNRM